MQLKAQYALLHRQLGSRQPGLPAIAALLGCSERNARMRLRKMQAEGWLHWQPGRGRGHRSTLEWLREPQQLQLDELLQLVGRGELEQAFARLKPAQRERLMARLPEFLGASPPQRLLRMAVARPLTTLDPLLVFSSLEAHVVRQVFERLVGFDGTRQQVVPALAHHWESAAGARRWRFWLRPGLRFHDGTPLEAADVAASVLRLRDQPNPWQRQYRHLRAIELHGAESISFELGDEDQLWPQRLATANASIVPRRRRADFARLPIGSGAFRVERHNPLRLGLVANEQHYRERPLIQRLELWFISGGAGAFDLEPGVTAPTPGGRLQSACTYLLTPAGRRALTGAARRDWACFLASPPLVGAGDPQRLPAHALLPDWPAVPLAGRARCPWPRGSRRVLVSLALPGLRALGDALQRRLGEAGVQLERRLLDHAAFERLDDWWHEADLVLCSEVLHDDRDYGCHEWWGSNRMLRRALAPAAATALDRRLHAVQRTPDAAQRAALIESTGHWLVGEGWLLPLSHEWQGVHASAALAGVQLGPNGWMDFSALWLKDSD
ncbi:SgrR family transcriptional regulator [Aquincola sp. S2]|uniref:SgrR family transcriptional regulator n=1 Tax=Pseudaquabacterium terrae TaxID=2732868 RepID=A0ABX2EHW5_9BURK|nr:ABC transporter substrate-binding protein [Aquabacterium terrae]NRF68222.1 SgrR family transcriptional regulator [Aquabacterium terrae]